MGRDKNLRENENLFSTFSFRSGKLDAQASGENNGAFGPPRRNVP